MKSPSLFFSLPCDVGPKLSSLPSHFFFSFLSYKLLYFPISYFFPAIFSHTQDDTALLDQIVTQLLSALVDPKLTVAALRGLGNVVSCTPEQVFDKYTLVFY